MSPITELTPQEAKRLLDAIRASTRRQWVAAELAHLWARLLRRDARLRRGGRHHRKGGRR